MIGETKVTAGIDIGSTTSKAVILKGGEIASHFIGSSTINPKKTAQNVYREALSRAGIDMDQVSYVVGTGYGRMKVEFANESVSEITCHARGAHYLLPTVRTVIDIGGQDTKVISIGKSGFVREFVMNDKCAAGTGRFLEFMARSMGLTVKDMVRIHFEEGDPVLISSVCSVFAESEVINLINDEVPLPSIIKGLHKSIAGKVITLVRRVGMEQDIVMTGGVAKNKGVFETLENDLGFKLVTMPEDIDPQIIGALGAAVIGINKKTAIKKGGF